MADTTIDADALLAQLAELRELIDEAQGVLDGAYAQRLDIFRTLSDHGVPQRVIGDAAGVTANAVGYALHAHGRKATG